MEIINMFFAKVGNKESRVSTIVIRGATDNYMDDIERAVDDGVNVFKGVCKDGRLTAGGGSTEIELARQVKCEFNLLLRSPICSPGR